MVALALVLGLCLPTGAQEPPSERFRYRFEPNHQSRYRVSAQMSGTLPLFGGLPVEKAVLDMAVVLKVRGVRADGNAELGVDIETFRVEMDGQSLPLPLERLREGVRHLVYVVNAQGEVLERKGSGVLPLNLPIPGVEASQIPLLVLQLVFPKEPITLGQEWQYTRAMTASVGDPHASFSVRWLKDEPVNGVTATLFNQKMRWNRSFKADIFDLPITDESLVVKQIEQSVTGEAQVWFDKASGGLLKADLNAQFEQQTHLLNPSEAAGTPAPVRLTAKVQITREDNAPRETKPTGT